MHALRVHLLEITYKFLKAIRMPAYALPTIGFPMLFYVFFGLAFGSKQGGGVNMATYLIATYGCFGVIYILPSSQDGDDAFALCASLRPDVLLPDIEMPKRTGLELAAAVKQQIPATKIILLTTSARRGDLRPRPHDRRPRKLPQDWPPAAL